MAALRERDRRWQRRLNQDRPPHAADNEVSIEGLGNPVVRARYRTNQMPSVPLGLRPSRDIGRHGRSRITRAEPKR